MGDPIGLSGPRYRGADIAGRPSARAQCGSLDTRASLAAGLGRAKGAAPNEPLSLGLQARIHGSATEAHRASRPIDDCKVVPKYWATENDFPKRDNLSENRSLIG